MNTLAIIPARGGSKRIPRKNVKDFLGKPVISYSIQAAQISGLFSEIMVSTDDEEIASISQSYGASIPFLRNHITASDVATTLQVITEVVDGYRAIGREFSEICCIYPAAPLIKAETLNRGYSKLLETGASIVLPLVAFDYPIWRGFRIIDDHHAAFLWPQYKSARSQDLEKVYHDAGQWYWFRPEKIRDNFFPENEVVGICLSESEVQDIDTFTDWDMAILKYQQLNGR